jgi:hypothetical protein
MSVFHSSEQFYGIMAEVFDKVAEDTERTKAFTRSKLVIRMKTTHPDAEILIDGRHNPFEIFYGHRPGNADVEIMLTTGLLHQIWLGHASTRDSFFSGKIRTRGSLLKIMQLTELFYECERVYPEVARRHGLVK